MKSEIMGSFFMPEYIVITICIFVLLLCGVLVKPCRAVGFTPFKVLYMLLTVSVLAQFNWRASVEVCINAAAGAMVFIPVLLAKGNDSGNGVLSTVVLFAVLGALLSKTGYFYGGNNGLLCGILGGLAAVVLAPMPSSAVFAACTVPVFADIAEAFFEMAATGYASLEISTATLTAQLTALCICVFAVWVSSLTSAVRVE